MVDDPFTSPTTTAPEITSTSSLWTWLIALALGMLIVGLGLVLLLLPLWNRGRYSQSITNLKMIGLALHNYHDDFGSFPPAYTVDEAGQPLHSWRTLLLPYLDEQAVYDTIDLSKPWDDPANARAFETEVRVYQNQAAGNHTNFLGVSGPNSVFSETDTVTRGEITDGTSNTLLLVEVPLDRTVSWMTPLDADDVVVWGTDPASDFSISGGFHGLLADGSQRRIPLSIEKPTLQSLLTISGGDPIGDF